MATVSGNIARVITTDALWRQLHDSLRDQISTGTLQPGDRLPSEPELMAAHHIRSRATVATAVRALAAEGLIDRQRRVRRRDPIEIRVTATESLTWQEDVQRAGRITGPPQISVTIKGDRLIRRVLRDLDGEPHNVAEWTFPLEVAQGTRLAYDYDIPEGSVRYLEEGLGWDHMEQVTAFEARMPSPVETDALRIPPGVPVITEHRTGSQDGTRVFASVRILRADRTRLIP